MGKLRTALQKRDLEILDFLWRWKLATTSTLALKFFPGSKVKVAYNRLLMLSYSRHIRFRLDLDHQFYAWVLDVNGYKNLKTRLPVLRLPGHGSESIEHDLIVSAVQNGEWLVDAPKGVEMVTETELKRLPLDFFPTWVPSSTVRISDGYWKIPVGEMDAIIGLEVELHQKAYSDYVTIGKFYALQNLIYRILWVVPRISMGRNIGNIIQATNPLKPFNHNFITVDDFRASGWDTKIQLGPDLGKTVNQLLGAAPVRPSCERMTLALLDARKCSYESVTYDIKPTL